MFCGISAERTVGKTMSDNTSSRPIAVTRSSMAPLDEYVAEIAPLWESRWLTNRGEKHRQLEADLQDYLQSPHASLFTNGHAALECALEALELTPGGEIITTPFTFASTTHAITRKGFIPVFADIKPTDYTLDPEKIEDLITPNTVAIMPVHVYGSLCDTEAIEALAKKHNLKVIYDAAHAFGVKRQGVSAATFGDVSMFSFHATKVFNTIEGGGLTFTDDELATRLDEWKNFGIAADGQTVFAGGNGKMNEFCAAMGICNLRHIEEEIAKRKQAFEYYIERLGKLEGVKLLEIPNDVEHNYAYFPVVFEDASHTTRDEVAAALAAQDIFARKYFYPLTSEFACYSADFTAQEDTPVAYDIAERVLTLPLYADLSNDDIDRICNIVISCVKN